MDEARYEYDNLKVDPPRVDDGWYLVKGGMTYRVDVPIDNMRFTKSINILTGEVHYPSKGDRIRGMSDEELAEFLSIQMVAEVVHGWKSWLDWLKQEAKDD